MPSTIAQTVGSLVVQSVGEKLKESVQQNIDNLLHGVVGGQHGGKHGALTPEEVIEESFSGLTKLVVKQKFDVLETLVSAATNVAGFGVLAGVGEEANKYNVYFEKTGHASALGGDRGHLQFRIEEQSQMFGWTGRCLCQPHHKLRLHVFQHQQKKGSGSIMYMNRECKCGCCFACCDICQQEMTVHLGSSNGSQMDNENKPLARVREPFLGGGLSPTLEVMDRDGNEIAQIQSEAICCIGGICCDHTFRILDPKTREIIGTIVKLKPDEAGGAAQWAKELFSDSSDVFSMTVPQDMPPENKVAMLSALQLIEYWLFEGQGDLFVNPFDRTYSFKCCDLYCCGCVFPCACKSWCGGRCCCC